MHLQWNNVMSSVQLAVCLGLLPVEVRIVSNSLAYFWSLLLLLCGLNMIVGEQYYCTLKCHGWLISLDTNEDKWMRSGYRRLKLITKRELKGEKRAKSTVRMEFLREV